MKRISATAAARNFSDVLDAVERDGETFVIERRGRTIARLTSEPRANGRHVKEVLASAEFGPDMMDEIRAVRSLLTDEVTGWDD